MRDFVIFVGFFCGFWIFLSCWLWWFVLFFIFGGKFLLYVVYVVFWGGYDWIFDMFWNGMILGCKMVGEMRGCVVGGYWWVEKGMYVRYGIEEERG